MWPTRACFWRPMRPVTSPPQRCRWMPAVHNARSQSMTDLAKYGPWAVIAGGSEGVGAEFARMLAEDGFNLVLLARKAGPLEQTAQKCRELGVQARTLSVDLVEAQSISRVVEATADLDVGLLIYNAGASTCNEPFLEADLDDFRKVTDLNVTRMLELV